LGGDCKKKKGEALIKSRQKKKRSEHNERVVQKTRLIAKPSLPLPFDQGRKEKTRKKEESVSLVAPLVRVKERGRKKKEGPKAAQQSTSSPKEALGGGRQGKGR